MNKTQKKLMFNECLIETPEKFYSATDFFLSQNNVKAKYQ